MASVIGSAQPEPQRTEITGHGPGGSPGGGGGPESDPVAGAALTVHMGSTTGVHGIADTSVLVTQAQLNTAIANAVTTLTATINSLTARIAALEAAPAELDEDSVREVVTEMAGSEGPYIRGEVSETDPDEDTDRWPDGTPVDYIWIDADDS